MQNLNLYEIHTENSVWWVAAEDEFYVLSILRGEMEDLEFSDEEIDEVTACPRVKKVNPKKAQSISAKTDEFGDPTHSLWEVFKQETKPGLVSYELET